MQNPSCSFHGAPLPIAIWPFEPVMMEEKVVAPNGTEYTRLYGRGIRILEAIAGHLNFTIGEALPAKISKDVSRKHLFIVYVDTGIGARA